MEIQIILILHYPSPVGANICQLPSMLAAHHWMLSYSLVEIITEKSCPAEL